MLKHNKKRNIGLLSEFFARHIALAAVEFRYDDIDKAKNLWNKHVSNNKLLSKEFALFESLHKVHIKDSNVASDLLRQTKLQASKLEEKALEEAKTNFIHEINNTLKDEDFFNRPVEDFRTIATIQVLLKSWRTKDESPNLAFVSKLEDVVLEHIKTEKPPLGKLDEALLNHTQEDINKLVVNVFREKVEKKYNDLLSEDQKHILGLFIFAKNQPDSQKALTESLTKIRDNALSNIDKEIKKDNKVATKDKLLEAKNLLLSNSYNLESPNEETLAYYLAVCNLNKELESNK